MQLALVSGSFFRMGRVPLRRSFRLLAAAVFLVAPAAPLHALTEA